jgi:hypothetical protein
MPGSTPPQNNRLAGMHRTTEGEIGVMLEFGFFMISTDDVRGGLASCRSGGKFPRRYSLAYPT